MKKSHVRELSIAEWRELHAICAKYLRRRFSRYLLPPCDFDDMLVEASDEAIERICTKDEEIRNLKSFMKRVAYFSVVKALERRDYRRNLIWIDAMPLSTPNVNSENADDEPEDYGFVISDDGAGAEKIRADAERRLNADRPPLWLGLFRIAAKAQKGKARKVLNALKQDSRHVIAAEIAGIPIRTFYRILKKVQSDFALCLQAYHEHLRTR